MIGACLLRCSTRSRGACCCSEKHDEQARKKAPSSRARG
ncbi:hypothetical protein APV28_0927 [Comamonas testosteroni]|nr:hypothetical protein APV28_0927 [Comamonas testosteroni]